MPVFKASNKVFKRGCLLPTPLSPPNHPSPWCEREMGFLPLSMLLTEFLWIWASQLVHEMTSCGLVHGNQSTKLLQQRMAMLVLPLLYRTWLLQSGAR